MSRKGSLGDFLEGSLKEFKRRGRSDSALDRPSAFDKSASASGSSSTAASSARKSIMPLVSRLPSFRRSDGWRQAPSHDKRPLLIMRLSSQSFLDSVVLDDTSKNTLYTMKTEGATTRITRSISATTQFCTIRWPKTLPAIVKGKMATDGVSIHLGDARFIGGENLLKRGPKPDSSRKFNLPNYSQVLKWKRYGNIYWCTTLSVRGPVAVLEMAKDKTPTKLTVYETLHDKYDTKGVLSYHGVYIPLMDYLLVTALLLVTDLQEWMLVKKVEGRNIIVPNPLGQEGSAVETTTSDVQWRKILYREPMYRRLASETSSTYTWFTDSDSTHYPITPTSPRSPHQVYGHPPSAPAGESILSFTDSEYEGDNEEVTVRPISPSMESAFYPSQSDVAPAHGYADPSYHRKSMPPPPVPPLPAQFQGSNVSLPSPPVSTPASPSRPLRRLPQPPVQRPGHLTFASAASSSTSTPSSSSSRSPPHPPHPLSIPTPSYDTAIGSSSTDSAAQTKPHGIVNRTRSMTARAAPRPLPTVPSANVHALRRSRSHALLADETASSSMSNEILLPPPPPLSPTSQRSLPPTPRVPVSDPTSPPPEVAQEELRAAVAAVRALRGQQHANQHRHHHNHHHYQSQGVDILPPLPSPPGSAKSEEDDVAQWVQILTSPGGAAGRNAPMTPFTRQMFDAPPPAYNTLTFSHPPPPLPPPPPAAQSAFESQS